MAAWKNLDTLASYGELSKLKNHVDIAKAMSGENGAERVAKYSVPMAAGLCYNYAAKEVDETVLAALEKLANEAELSEKFEELYNCLLYTSQSDLKNTTPLQIWQMRSYKSTHTLSQASLFQIDPALF